MVTSVLNNATAKTSSTRYSENETSAKGGHCHRAMNRRSMIHVVTYPVPATTPTIPPHRAR